MGATGQTTSFFTRRWSPPPAPLAAASFDREGLARKAADFTTPEFIGTQIVPLIRMERGVAIARGAAVRISSRIPERAA